MSAADLANDQDRELTVVTAERDDLQLRLDEAEAVIDAVRKVRDWVVNEQHYTFTISADHPDTWAVLTARGIALRDTSARLNRIDGL